MMIDMSDNTDDTEDDAVDVDDDGDGECEDEDTADEDDEDEDDDYDDGPPRTMHMVGDNHTHVALESARFPDIPMETIHLSVCRLSKKHPCHL